MHIPRVILQDHPQAAGQYQVDGGGCVTIALEPSFVQNTKALRAILAHETSHYVLENNGIRERDPESNERLTDLAVFALGLGGLYLEGYEAQPSRGGGLALVDKSAEDRDEAVPTKKAENGDGAALRCSF
jgi:hypothetical protein